MVRPWVSALTSFHNTPIFGRIWATVAALAAYCASWCSSKNTCTSRSPLSRLNFTAFSAWCSGCCWSFAPTLRTTAGGKGELWGQLVNDCRNLAIKVQTCVRADAEDKVRLGWWLSGFAFALKGHLRGGVRLADLPGLTDIAGNTNPPHVPAYISARIYDQFETWRQNDQLGGFELLFLDQHASSLMNVCGACERIQKSPISLSYRWFIRQSIAIYLLTLPWGLMQSFHWWTIPAVAMLGYFMVGVEMIAEQIEDPFGVDEDDIMLDSLCETIERSVSGILSERTSIST